MRRCNSVAEQKREWLISSSNKDGVRLYGGGMPSYGIKKTLSLTRFSCLVCYDPEKL